MPLQLDCDLNGASVPLRHPWRRCIGSCHAPTALRADWQAQLRQARAELGFEYIRFHGLLGDGMGTVSRPAEAGVGADGGELVYSFFNIDQIFDFLLSIGMRPVIELSFMPSALASGSDTVFHYRANITPPRDMAQWAELVRRLAAHCVERYGIAEVAQWYFEVWNEPNLRQFWTGSQQEYFALYEASVTAIKGVDARLLVGGPATAQNAWIEDFMQFCSTRQLPVDFVSTHFYPTDAFGEVGADTLTQLEHTPLDEMRTRALTARGQAQGKPLFYTEWNTSSNPRDTLHDSSFGAAFAARIALSVDDVVDAYSYWVFSDIFEELSFPSAPFHGGFGLLNLHGIKKPAHKAFELLAELGDRHFPVVQQQTQQHATVALWVGEKGEHAAETHILCVNQAMPRHAIQTEDIAVRLHTRPGETVKSATLVRIDDTSCNPALLWKQMGQPGYLSAGEIETLKKSTELLEAVAEFDTGAVHTIVTFQAAPQSLSFLRIIWEHLDHDVLPKSEHTAAASLALQSAERLI
ncbi:GH39 family glycosyl hydrolase [Undibacterium sp. TJN25]|uniref:GH39 family glycosyl hydrolase n=1 Tax=Undibacterium sp. TJN25 TaxID=3413056 RepID=UPI003BF0878A